MKQTNDSAHSRAVRRLPGLALALGLLLTASGHAGATTLFTDSLQGTLSQWRDPSGAAAIVAAPGGGNALTFVALQGGVNLVATQSTFTSATGLFTIAFDLDANCGHTSGCGAFVWANGAQSSTRTSGWILSDTDFGIDKVFVDASGWETISYTFAGTSTALAFEDYYNSPYARAYPTAGAIYIRNLTLTDDPSGLADGTLTVSTAGANIAEPATLAISGAAMLGLIGFRFRARRSAGAPPAA